MTSEHKERYESIDGLRAYAALGIVLMHVLSNVPVAPSKSFITSDFIPWFTDFTLLFMVVSGFSISCGYYSKFLNGTIKATFFYRKRYLRLLPFFALMCLLDFAADPSLRALYETFADLTMCIGLLPNVNINVIGVGWFIGLVMLFYIMYPFVVFLQKTKTRSILTFLCAIALFWIAVQCTNHPELLDRSNMVHSLPLFLLGGIIYLFRNEIITFVKRFYYLFLILAVAVTIVPFIIDRNIIFDNLMSSILVFGIYLIVAISSKNFILCNRFTKYIGGISLEIYLCHMVIFRIFELTKPASWISNPDLLYIVTSISVILGSIAFSHIVKYKLLNKLQILK